MTRRFTFIAPLLAASPGEGVQFSDGRIILNPAGHQQPIVMDAETAVASRFLERVAWIDPEETPDV